MIITERAVINGQRQRTDIEDATGDVTITDNHVCQRERAVVTDGTPRRVTSVGVATVTAIRADNAAVRDRHAGDGDGLACLNLEHTEVCGRGAGSLNRQDAGAW